MYVLFIVCHCQWLRSNNHVINEYIDIDRQYIIGLGLKRRLQSELNWIGSSDCGLAACRRSAIATIDACR